MCLSQFFLTGWTTHCSDGINEERPKVLVGDSGAGPTDDCQRVTVGPKMCDQHFE